MDHLEDKTRNLYYNLTRTAPQKLAIEVGEPNTI